MTEKKLLQLRDPIEDMMDVELRKAQALGMALDQVFYNAGARQADDLICQCCGARGHHEALCPERFPRNGGR